LEEAAIDLDRPAEPGPAAAVGERTDPVLLHAMSWSAEFGVDAVTPAVGAHLRLLAATAQARSVVEIGTGLGVSGLWLLRGMRPDGVLTTVDVDLDHQDMARQVFAAAGIAPGRSRLIAGSARQILPRLADGGYDLVFVDADFPDGEDRPYCIAAAHRLLRDSGLLVVRGEAPELADAPEWTVTALPGLSCAIRN
jgi:predicted O-methyltransferase YrrM